MNDPVSWSTHLPALAPGHAAYVTLDLLGAVLAGISGATAAKRRGLDLFGILVVAHVTAVAGGIFRDLCIGALPPVGVADWRYLAATASGACLALWATPVLDRLRHPVAVSDALALGFYAVVGAHKVVAAGHGAHLAVLLGTATAVGGGVVRDVWLGRVPIIFRSEVYALAAMAAALVQVVGERNGWPAVTTPWLAALSATLLRLLALRFHWHLPVWPSAPHGATIVGANDRDAPPRD